MKAKDGDCETKHLGCNIVQSSAGGESFLYCRDCKVEVIPRVRFVGGWSTDLDVRKGILEARRRVDKILRTGAGS